MASSPTNRVRYLLNLPLDTAGYYGSRRITKTPTTLTGGDHGLYSYRLCIAWKDGNDWLVTNERNSATTNRHIRAVHAVLSQEMQTVGNEETTERRYLSYEGFKTMTIPVTRYRPYGTES